MTTIAPNDSNILYSPYTWKVDATRARTLNSGAYLRATIQGSPADLSLLLDFTGLSSNKGVIWHKTDDGPWVRYWTGNGAIIPLTINPNWPVHTVEMRVAVRGGDAEIWTDPPNGVIQFAGFSSSSTISTRKVWPRPLSALAVGDSLAMGILTVNGTTGNDASFGWAYPLADALGCEVGVRGHGGVGLTVAGDGGVPKFGSSWNMLWGSTPADMTQAPDVIITMPGTNDGGATDALVTAETTAWLNAMLAATPATTGIVVVRNLKGSKAAAIQAGIAACTTPGRVKWVDTTGWWASADSKDGTHPWGYVNQHEVSPRIAAGVRSFVQSLAASQASNQFVYKGAAWVAV
ncbi:hypothetical protein [Pseudarthrobacter sp. NIBRBAC000502770]|uniref:hypothetical protein n=1 Tax=Pseudarthrobacter sp. NIBRBAC000502770 TaxID=2590785 RepID=UPI00113FED35|nr:hypothetical protein [Pseudarthrobacter sp. NIBRBAC000502770]QDG90690.1 hypothetical protein NIBR502770_20930 [Pseudarthrobacter sp. NIBRBAC000502770]